MGGSSSSLSPQSTLHQPLPLASEQLWKEGDTKHLATTTVLCHKVKTHGGVLSQPHHPIPPPHWQVHFNKDLQDKVSLYQQGEARGGSLVQGGWVPGHLDSLSRLGRKCRLGAWSKVGLAAWTPGFFPNPGRGAWWHWVKGARCLHSRFSQPPEKQEDMTGSSLPPCCRGKCKVPGRGWRADVGAGGSLLCTDAPRVPHPAASPHLAIPPCRSLPGQRDAGVLPWLAQPGPQWRPASWGPGPMPG